MVEIKEGRWYRRRDGEIVGPAKRSTQPVFPFRAGGSSYTPAGRFWAGPTDHPRDLVEEVDPPVGAANEPTESTGAMTLRDQFAAHALSGLINGAGGGVLPSASEAIARDAYAIADAMLAARRGGA